MEIKHVQNPRPFTSSKRTDRSLLFGLPCTLEEIHTHDEERLTDEVTFRLTVPIGESDEATTSLWRAMILLSLPDTAGVKPVPTAGETRDGKLVPQPHNPQHRLTLLVDYLREVGFDITDWTTGDDRVLVVRPPKVPK